MAAGLGVRWTVGDVSARGFEALRLSIEGALRLWGDRAAYVVCVNTVSVDSVRQRMGTISDRVLWHSATQEFPAWLRTHFDEGLAEGVGWKFAPVRLFPDRFELSLDNDCILWEAPAAISAWLEGMHPFVIAEDVRTCAGQFAAVCGPHPRNSGIRGLPPHFNLEDALRQVLSTKARLLSSELDEQGLQIAALEQSGRVGVVRVDEVSICSPFPPHRDGLGTCGAHFVGLNSRNLPWAWKGRPATQVTEEHWDRLRAAVESRVFRSSVESSRTHV